MQPFPLPKLSNLFSIIKNIKTMYAAFLNKAAVFRNTIFTFQILFSLDFLQKDIADMVWLYRCCLQIRCYMRLWRIPEEMLFRLPILQVIVQMISSSIRSFLFYGTHIFFEINNFIC